MEFVQRGGRGQTPNPNLHFGSIEKHSGYSLDRLISIFGSKLQGEGGSTKIWTKSILSFFLNEDLPYAGLATAVSLSGKIHQKQWSTVCTAPLGPIFPSTMATMFVPAAMYRVRTLLGPIIMFYQFFIQSHWITEMMSHPMKF